jgi:hypothetical protein
VTRWIRTAGIVAGAVASAGVLATAALAGPAGQAVSSATDEACGNLAPALREAKSASVAALPACSDAGGVQAPEFSWTGPGAIDPRAAVPSDLPSDLPGGTPGTEAQETPDLPRLPFEPDLGRDPSLPELSGPELGGAQPQLPGGTGLPTEPNLGGQPELPNVGPSELAGNPNLDPPSTGQPGLPDVAGSGLPAKPELPEVPAAPAPLG